jgi:hypothetical protein
MGNHPALLNMEIAMRSGIFLTLLGLLLVQLTACQGPPPTQIVVVVTATPAELQVVPTETLPPPETTATPSPQPPTATPNTFPTPTFGQIQVAEQVFEHGRMVWIQPRKQIWVMVDTGNGSGPWTVYDDVFMDGEPESDPTIVVPAGQYQPTRGFGKLWRETGDIRENLGFGLTPEFGYVSNYEYHPGGSTVNGQYVTGPGYHILFNLYGNDKFQFNEVDGTWAKVK